MNTEKIPVNQQISKLIRNSQCTFKLRNDTLNVTKIEELSIQNPENGDFGEWNAKYIGNTKLENKDNLGNCKSVQYRIEGYAKIEGDTVIDIDKTISSNKAY